MSAAHPDQGHQADGVQQKGHSDAGQSGQGEDQGEHHVCSLWADIDKTPGAWLLQVEAPDTKNWQQCNTASKGPHRQHYVDGSTPFLAERSYERHGDADEALHCHGGAEQKWAQAVKNHGHAHEVAEVAVRVQSAPVKVSHVESSHDASGDQKTHEVSDHQTTEEDEEGGARATLRSAERLD